MHSRVFIIGVNVLLVGRARKVRVVVYFKETSQKP